MTTFVRVSVAPALARASAVFFRKTDFAWGSVATTGFGEPMAPVEVRSTERNGAAKPRPSPRRMGKDKLNYSELAELTGDKPGAVAKWLSENGGKFRYTQKGEGSRGEQTFSVQAYLKLRPKKRKRKT